MSVIWWQFNISEGVTSKHSRFRIITWNQILCCFDHIEINAFQKLNWNSSDMSYMIFNDILVVGKAVKGSKGSNIVRNRYNLSPSCWFVGKQEEPVECQNCNRLYKNRSCLSSHLSQDCGKNARFQCPLCQYVFKRKHNLKQHLLGKHGLSKIPNFNSQ